MYEVILEEPAKQFIRTLSKDKQKEILDKLTKLETNPQLGKPLMGRLAGLRSLTSGGGHHNKTIFTAISNEETLNLAIAFMEDLCRKTEKPHQGIYFVAPLSHFGRLGMNKGE